MPKYTTLHLEDEPLGAGRVLTIALNRPTRRNALTAEMVYELTIALREAEETRAGIIVLRGMGDNFCSGLDLSELRAMAHRSPEEHHLDSQNLADLYRSLYAISIPTIAEVRGFALAGGMGLATLCDFTLAAEDAHFGYPEVRIGFIPAIVSSFLLLQVGEKQARDLVLTGRTIDAVEARALGLVTRVLPAPELSGAVRELCSTLLENSPSSLRATKHFLYEQQIERLGRSARAAVTINAELRTTQDFKEGLAAFLDKRRPAWPSRA